MKIKVTTLDSAAWPGQYIAPVDTDEFMRGALVPAEAYDADEQDWQLVIKRRGHADIGDLLLQSHDGERYWQRGQQWGATCWQLINDNGEPVVDGAVEDES